MGIDYSYDCIAAKVVQRLAVYGDKEVLLCDLQFEDEHEHALAPLQGVLVVLEGEEADLEQYPENFLSEDAPAEDYDRYERLCANYPGYHAHDPKQLARLLAETP